MKDCILFILFLIGLIFTIKERVDFKKKESLYNKKYISLFNENSFLKIMLFLGLSIDKGMQAFNYLFPGGSL